MFIKEIILKNFRIYQGEHSMSFEKDNEKNVYIISGNNGYGKTSFLTSLIWCLYGKHMQEVDGSFKRQILDMGGYRKYIMSCLNYAAAAGSNKSLSVTMHFSDMQIPGFTCNEISVCRTYFTDREHEELEILIDKKPNELIQEVGKEIFIHDFILPKEIAKFFFFDAEKNVALAEIKSVNDKVTLSKAYSEILGIKKYEDLKTHLNDLRMRFRKSSATEGDSVNILKLEQEIESLHKLIYEKHEKLEELSEEKIQLKLKSERLQEKLIREGSGITLEQVKKMQQQRSRLQKEHEILKHGFVEMIDLAPFAIAGNLMKQIEMQLKQESQNASKQLDPVLIAGKIKSVLRDLNKVKAVGLKIDQKTRDFFSRAISTLINKHFEAPSQTSPLDSSLHLAKEEESHFSGIMLQLKTTFRNSLMDTSRNIRNNRTEFNKINKQLVEAESKENDKLIQSFRDDKMSIDNRLQDTDALIIEANVELSVAQHQFANKKKVIEEMAKKVTLETRYKEKDQLASKIISELESFLLKIKNEKKQALEKRIKESLDSLMHKKDFITRVKVLIDNDILDIHLFNKKTEIIKDNLSKGEQQIYATCLLKALVEESNIDFPVFVDSPMQKYDVQHAEKVILSFYPEISKQVVLFPLLNKEISNEEFQLLERFVKDCYQINNHPDSGSFFVKVKNGQLFNKQIKDIAYAS